MAINISNNKFRIPLFICVISSPILLGFLITRFAVNVPFWDEWFTPGDLFNKIHSSGHISFPDLIAQHNESRKVFPKLLFLAVASLTHWDTRYQMAIIFLMACLISINLFYIARETIDSQNISTKSDRKGIRLLIFMALANLLVFSPAQHDNWLWGIQIVVFAPILCLTTGILLWYSKFKIGWKVLLSAVLSVVSTFSYANGLLCWFLFPLTMVLLGHWKLLKGRVNLIAFWIVSCVSSLILYFWNYVKPPDVPGLFEALFHPLKALNYFFAFLGSSLAGGNLLIASIVGFLVVLLSGLLGIFFLARWENEGLRYRAAGWSTLLVYSLISAIVTTSGRVGFGVEQALVSRYTTFSVYSIIGLLGLITIASNEIQTGENRAVILPYWPHKLSLKQIARCSSSLLAVALVIVHLSVQSIYINAMDLMYRDRLYSKVCLTYADFVEDRCITQSLANILSVFRRNLKATRALGILKQEDFAQNAQIINAQKTASSSYSYGWIDAVKPMSGDDLVVSGWATLENPGRAADTVLLSYQDDKGEPRIFTVAPVKFDRPDVSNVKQNSAYTRSGWAVQFSRKSLPSRKVEIKAWAYDIKTKHSYPLNGVHTLN